MALLPNIGTVSDMGQTLTHVHRLSKRRISENRLIESLACPEIIYFEKGVESPVGSSLEKVDVKFVKIEGYVESFSGSPLYLFFRRRFDGCRMLDINEARSWAGTFVGTYQHLLSYVIPDNPSSVIADVGKNELITLDSLSHLYSLLLDKEHWYSNSSANKYARLKYYIKHSLKLSKNFLKDVEGSVIYNRDETKLLFNTRLYCKYGYYIVMMADIINQQSVVNMTVVEPGAFVTCYGFETEARPEPFNIAEHISDYVFDASESNFNLLDSQRLKHVIIDRVNRMGSLDNKCGDLDLSLAIQNSVKIAIQLSKTNPSYVHPMYSVEYNEIQFLIPLHINFNQLNSPRCALVVRKNEVGVWTLQTVLDLNQAYTNARIVRRPDELWLRMEVCHSGLPPADSEKKNRH